MGVRSAPCFWNGDRAWARRYSVAVSLHAHTARSKESLSFVPRYVERIPFVSLFFDRENQRRHRKGAKTIDFSNGYWTPPLCKKAVLQAERAGIEGKLDLGALVSVTDHDEIGPEVHGKSSPISLEWTVWVEQGIFHLGVHNLPQKEALAISRRLLSHRHDQDLHRLEQLLAWLNEFPEILLVWNHPLSDLAGLGAERFRSLAGRFLRRYGRWIHALEFNGYRPWQENQKVAGLAEYFDLPLVSGGDRHGCARNAVLNFTHAATFSEFVSEVRCDKYSRVFILPEYRENLLARRWESVADFFRYYPRDPESRRRWVDRVFFQLEDGMVRPLSFYWKRTIPVWVKLAIAFLRVAGTRSFRSAIQRAFLAKQEVGVEWHPSERSWENWRGRRLDSEIVRPSGGIAPTCR